MRDVQYGAGNFRERMNGTRTAIDGVCTCSSAESPRNEYVRLKLRLRPQTSRTRLRSSYLNVARCRRRSLWNMLDYYRTTPIVKSHSVVSNVNCIPRRGGKSVRTLMFVISIGGNSSWDEWTDGRTYAEYIRATNRAGPRAIGDTTRIFSARNDECIFRTYFETLVRWKTDRDESNGAPAAQRRAGGKGVAEEEWQGRTYAATALTRKTKKRTERKKERMETSKTHPELRAPAHVCWAG